MIHMIKDRWVGAFGEYEIPPAITWLAKKAQANAGLPDFDTSELFRPNFWLEPGYRVRQEWGEWADARAREEYEAKLVGPRTREEQGLAREQADTPDFCPTCGRDLTKEE